MPENEDAKADPDTVKAIHAKVVRLLQRGAAGWADNRGKEPKYHPATLIRHVLYRGGGGGGDGTRWKFNAGMVLDEGPGGTLADSLSVDHETVK
jgi:hypothetical protein